MNRLLYVIAFARPFERMKSFYRDAIGLEVRHEEEGWIEFAATGARLALHAIEDEDRQGLTLRFETADLDADLAAMASRGLHPMAPPREFAWGRVAEFADADGHPVSLVQPARGGGDGESNPLTSVIRNTPNYAAMLRFYRDGLGLTPRVESPHWAEFETGDTTLALHARPGDQHHPLHARQPVALVFEADDLDAWADELDAQGVSLEAPPADEGFGRFAEARDPGGWLVVLRENGPALTKEEVLAEAFEDAEVTHPVGMRRPLRKASAQAGRVAARARAQRRRAKPVPHHKPLSATTMAVAKERGEGPERTRVLPKRTADERKTRVKPAENRHMKAVIARVGTQRTATAQSSRGKPIKHAAAHRAPRPQPAPRRAAAPVRAAAPAPRATPARAARATPARATRARAATPTRARAAAPARTPRAKRAAPARTQRAAPARSKRATPARSRRATSRSAKPAPARRATKAAPRKRSSASRSTRRR